MRRVRRSGRQACNCEFGSKWKVLYEALVDPKTVIRQVCILTFRLVKCILYTRFELLQSYCTQTDEDLSGRTFHLNVFDLCNINASDRVIFEPLRKKEG